jgi:hypothetical protein
MADSEGGGLVVYNGRTSKMCRVESDSMKIPPDPTIVIQNQTYYFSDTIHGMTIIGRSKYFSRLFIMLITLYSRCLRILILTSDSIDLFASIISQ